MIVYTMHVPLEATTMPVTVLITCVVSGTSLWGTGASTHYNLLHFNFTYSLRAQKLLHTYVYIHAAHHATTQNQSL